MLAYLAAFSWLAALMLVIGIVLVIVEMLIPGFGLPGISGIILIIGGIIIQANSIQEAFLMLLVVIAILGIALICVLHSAQKGKISKSDLVLHATVGGDDAQSSLDYLIGKEGVVMNPLRPSGIADFDGVRLDVVAEASFVPKGTTVRVIKTEGTKIVVRETKE